MPLAFLPGAALALSRGRATRLLPASSYHGRRLYVAAPTRRAALRHTACVAVKKDTDEVEDDEKLDEAAMRAAEIHEVLSGLKDFKDRIIAGALNTTFSPRSSLCDTRLSPMRSIRQYEPGLWFADF